MYMSVFALKFKILDIRCWMLDDDLHLQTLQDVIENPESRIEYLFRIKYSRLSLQKATVN